MHRNLPIASALLAMALAAPALAADLAITSLEITQGFQSGTTTLVGGHPTMVRLRLTVTNSTAAVAGVDGVLRVFSMGVEVAGSPFRSVNGPISAPLTVNMATMDHTLNFVFVPPTSTDVDFVALVNPDGAVVESSLTNNTLTVSNKVFTCRKTVDIAYLSINYTPGGGQPAATFTDPGRGDNFLRGIYPVGEWNYHRSPTPILNWTTDINSSNSTLLNTLSTTRLTTIPGLGYARPEFIYGWLPGNPFSGNGQASGTPGDAAFGNAETSRFQRTFAHEVGHLWGRSHNSETVGVVATDVEHQLKDPLNLPQTHAATQHDVMVPGQLTNAAWVSSGTVGDCLTDARSQCGALYGGDGPDAGGSASDAAGRRAWAEALGERCLRVSGTVTHQPLAVELDPVTVLDAAPPTVDDPTGDLIVWALDAQGRLLRSTRWRSGSARESCSATGLLGKTPIFVTIPTTISRRAVAVVEIAQVATARLLARSAASANAPLVAARATAANGELWVSWNAQDADLDALTATVCWSPDAGNRWVPLVVDSAAGEVVAGLDQIPAPVGDGALVRVRVSDGFRTADAEVAVAINHDGLAGGANNAPDVHLITPNASQTVKQGGNLILHASGWDLEDELMAPAQLAWSSSIDGPLGTGRVMACGSLSAGTHAITLVGTDLGGLTTSRTVSVIVQARQLVDADLNGDGAIGGSDLAIMLANWGQAGFAAGDLDFNQIVDGSDLTLILANWSS